EAPFTPAPTQTESPRPQRGTPPVVVLAAVGGGGGLLLAGLITVTAMRRARTRARKQVTAPRVEARGFPGQVLSPVLRSAGPDLPVRVVTHPDAGTYTIQEEAR